MEHLVANAIINYHEGRAVRVALQFEDGSTLFRTIWQKDFQTALEWANQFQQAQAMRLNKGLSDGGPYTR